MAAVLLSSCEKIEPTAVTTDKLPAKGTVCGFLQFQYKDLDRNDQTAILPNEKVTVYRGIKDGSKMIYEAYSATTDRDGFYSISLPVAEGQTIDEVKVACEHQENRSYTALTPKLDKVTVDAIYKGEVTSDAVKAGQTTQLDLVLTVAVLLGQPNLQK